MSGGRVFWIRPAVARVLFELSDEIELAIVRGNYSAGDIIDSAGVRGIVLGALPGAAVSTAKALGQRVIAGARKVDHDESMLARVLKEYVGNPTRDELLARITEYNYVDGIFYLQRAGDREARELKYAYVVPCVNAAAENSDQLWGVDVMFNKQRWGSLDYVLKLTENPFYVYGFFKNMRFYPVTVLPTVDLGELSGLKTAAELLEEREGAKNEPDKEGS